MAPSPRARRTAPFLPALPCLSLFLLLSPLISLCCLHRTPWPAFSFDLSPRLRLLQAAAAPSCRLRPHRLRSQRPEPAGQPRPSSVSFSSFYFPCSLFESLSPSFLQVTAVATSLMELPRRTSLSFRARSGRGPLDLAASAMNPSISDLLCAPLRPLHHLHRAGGRLLEPLPRSPVLTSSQRAWTGQLRPLGRPFSSSSSSQALARCEKLLQPDPVRPDSSDSVHICFFAVRCDFPNCSENCSFTE